TVEDPEPLHGGVDVPGAVRVDADRTGRAERLAHGLQPCLLLTDRLAGLGDLDLRRRAPAGGTHDLSRTLRADGRHGDVDGDAVTHRGGEPLVGSLARSGPPAPRLVVGVVPE